MRHLHLFGLLLLLPLCLALSGCSDSSGPPAPITRESVARQAPEFTLTTLDGIPMRLSDLRGKVVFVNLWATWCPPCREELPTMVRF